MTMPNDSIPLDDIPLAADPSDKAARELADYKYRVAELDTSLRRLREDAAKQRKYAHESLARDLLAVVDNLDRAVEAATAAGDKGPLVKGVTATAAQLLETLKRYGTTKMDVRPGTAFDPNLHQAVAQEPTNDHEPGAVLRVYQAGFLLHDRVLRPATVVVASET